MESFKKLGHVVPCIITTNYDQFLEKYIFTRFKVYSKVSDYYYSDSEGIGEIYKIHGTASKPDTMILTHKDYKNFRKNSKIVTSKILSALCDYPMLILGYSMEDDDVKEIINDLISSLDEDKLQQVERNIIYVDYVEGQKDVIYKNRIFSYDNKTMSVSSIETDDFKKIFDEIADMTPSMSPLAIRKTRRMVKEIVLSEKKASNIALLGIDKRDDVSEDKIVVAFADKDTLQRLKKTELKFYSTDQMISDILDKNNRYLPQSVIDFFDIGSNIITSDQYYPIFHFTRLAEIPYEEFSPRMKKFYERKKEQFQKKLENVGSTKTIKNADIKTVEDLRELLFDHPGYFYRSDVIFYYYENDIIDEEIARSLLKDIQSAGIRHGEKSAFRGAVTYLSFKKYLIR